MDRTADFRIRLVAKAANHLRRAALDPHPQGSVRQRVWISVRDLFPSLPIPLFRGTGQDPPRLQQEPHHPRDLEYPFEIGRRGQGARV